MQKDLDYLYTNVLNLYFESYCPIGIIIATAVEIAGFVPCDGSDCSGSAYSLLTGNTTTPDLRGHFVIGASVDRPFLTEGPDSTGPPIAPFLGSVDAAGTHTHSGTTTQNGAHGHSYIEYDPNASIAGLFGQVSTSSIGTKANSSSNSAGSHSHTFTTNSAGLHTHGLAASGGDTETRPVNYAVTYFIRIN
jgi:hypothetical protein